MYFPYSWPKAYAADQTCQGEYFYVHSDHQYVIAVSSTSIQVWTGGQHRIKLGSYTKDAEALGREGCNITAHWCPQKNCLSVLTTHNLLHLYSLHITKEELFPSRGNLGVQRDLKRIEVYIKHSTALGDIAASCVYSNSSGILVGFQDGTLATYNWLGKLKDQQDPIGQELTDILSSGEQLDDLGSLQLGITAMDYCERTQLLALVLSDGSVALCKASDCGLSQLGEVVFSHWVCEPQEQALCARIGAEAQLLAVGTALGEVRLYRLLPSSVMGEHSPGAGEPGYLRVRSLALDDWGHKVAQTGPVSAVAWTPDCRALAVGYRQQGVVVWSPSGCRLMCSLRQTPALQSGLSAPGRATPQQQEGLLGEVGRQNSSSSSLTTTAEELSGMLEGGISALAWGPLGYQLALAETGYGTRLLEVLFAKTLPHHHRVAHAQRDSRAGPLVPGEELHLLQAHDRLLLITETLGSRDQGLLSPNMLGVDPGDPTSNTNDLTVHHVQLPVSYLNSNWPLTHAAVSSNGMDIAVAGRQGLALYSRQTERWRLFGDVSQERRVNCLVLGWLDNIVVACSANSAEDVGKGSAAAGGCSLLLFPKYHLDFSSLLVSHRLGQQPLAMDCVGSHILLASEPLELAVLEVEVSGGRSPLDQAKVKVSLARELSIASFGRPLRAIALVPAACSSGSGSAAAAHGSSNGDTQQLVERSSRPRQCVLLRWGGVMSVLDMERGSEQQLSREVESFWLSATMAVEPVVAAGPSRAPSALGLDHHDSFSRLGITDNGEASTTGDEQPVVVEMPWWAYGPKGMQLWFPSLLNRRRSGKGPLSPVHSTSQATGGTDIELEFDQEVYPVGISLADAAIVGITQRMIRAPGSRQPAAAATPPAAAAAAVQPASSLPCFYPVPESQPVLPCLLRRLLQQGAFTDALLLANKHQRGPHFARSLEWLLFTALESEPTQPAGKRTSYGMYRSLSGPYRQGEQHTRQPALPSSISSHMPSGRSTPHTALPIPITPLLNSAAELVRSFSQFADVVVSVARKTDASLWPALFTAVGSPSVLLEGLLEAGALRSAACFLLVVDRLEGASMAHQLAVRLIKASLRQGQYFLCAEILRFIVPPGEMESFLGMYDVQQQQEQQQEEQQEAAPTPAAAEQQQPASSSSGYLSWLGWFWGSSAAPEPPKPEDKQQAAAAALQPSGKQPDALTSRRSSATADPTTTTTPRTSATFTHTAAAARHGSAPGTIHRQSTADSAVSEGMTPGVHACQLVADHAWQLLDQGHLGALAQLLQAVSFLSGGLLRLMRCFKDPLVVLQAAQDVSAVDLLAALSSAVRELPVWENEAVEHNAAKVLQVCQALGVEAWTLAVGVLLVDMTVVLPFRDARPQVWAEFAAQLQADESFYFLHEILDVLSKAQGGSGGSSRSSSSSSSRSSSSGSREIEVAED